MRLLSQNRQYKLSYLPAGLPNTFKPTDVSPTSHVEPRCRRIWDVVLEDCPIKWTWNHGSVILHELDFLLIRVIYGVPSTTLRPTVY